MHMSVRGARETLWQHLGEGAISASAVDAADEFVVVPAPQWAGLVLAETRTGDDCLCFEHDLLRPVYTQVKLPRNEILTAWQAAESPVQNEQQKERARALLPRKKKVEATRQALAALYPDGVPIGLMCKARWTQ